MPKWDVTPFKIRDIAMLLNGSARQFSVGYDPVAGVTISGAGGYTD